jgi:hypothetical protein
MATKNCDGVACGEMIKKGSIPADRIDRESFIEWLIRLINSGHFTEVICNLDCNQWVPTGNYQCVLDANGNPTGEKLVEMQNSHTGVTQYIPGGTDLELCPANSVVILNPDYVVMTYKWNASAGEDLDSATAIVGSGLSSIDGKTIGWRMSGNSDTGLQQYMHWAGDQLQEGVETVMLDMRELRDSYDQVNQEFNVQLYANWYGQKGTGNVTLEVTAYRGGTMRIEGTEYVNDGGELIIDSAPVNVQVSTQGKNNYTNYATLYSHVGYVNYRKINPTEKEFEITVGAT